MAQVTEINRDIERCRLLPNDVEKLRCYEAISHPPSAAPSNPAGSEGAITQDPNWRLVRSRNPAGGKDAISIMRTADIARSDIDLAGLMIRCGDNGPVPQVLVVLLTPLPPRAHPKITLNAGGQVTSLSASVVPPGAELLLPDEASFQAMGAWLRSASLDISVTNDTDQIHGSVSLSGLGSALSLLNRDCAMR